MRWLAWVALLAAGCQTFDPKHPLVGKPSDFAAAPGYYVWVDDNNLWHVRFEGKGHRFQGSLAGLRGGVLELALTRPELKDAIALAGDAVQFDVESTAPDAPAEPHDGFDVRVVGGCARFDLYIDGHHHPDKVRMGPRAHRPGKMPFDRCP